MVSQVTLNDRSPAEAISFTEVNKRGDGHLRTTVILGVDTSDMYMWAVDLVSQLRFNHPFITLLHATNKDCPIADANPQLEAEYGKFLEDLGVQALRQAHRYASTKNLDASTKQEFGRAADVMMREAAETHSDLIALCAIRHGDWNKGYLGSAACALALYGDQSLLIAKTAVAPERELRAVLAVDHSKATDNLIEKFLQLSPKGIKEVLVLSAYGIDDDVAREANASLPTFGERYNALLRETVEQKNLKIVNKLKEFGYVATSEVVRASPNEAIQNAMETFGGDIVVIGSTGADSLSGSRIGSFALHQITSEKFSVLMLRV